jgi:hypothetical protein
MMSLTLRRAVLLPAVEIPPGNQYADTSDCCHNGSQLINVLRDDLYLDYTNGDELTARQL